MPSSDEKRLLDDVLRDANYAAFRAETYELSRAEFNRGRQRSLKAVLLAVAAVVAVSTVLVFTLLAGKNRRHTQEAARTSPLGGLHAGELATVKTIPMKPAETLRSVLDRSLLVETAGTGNPGLQLVYSDPSSLVEINDAEFIALFRNDSLGYLRSGERLSLYYPLN